MTAGAAPAPEARGGVAESSVGGWPVEEFAAVPPLAQGAVDRAAHLRADAEWLASAWPEGRVLVVDASGDGKALVHDAGAGVALALLPGAQAPAVAPEQRLFLGLDADGVALFAVDAPLPDLPGARPTTLREVGHRLCGRDVGVFATGVALAHWHARHRFSGVTGEPTTVTDGGWVRQDAAGRQFWPRTDPAVIVVVHDGVPGPDGRCLLGHSGAWAGQPGVRRFSCLAGFVEPGESAEAAVAREVAEEVGVQVSDIAYVHSQPWPFPGSLMLGFTAYADPAQPVRVDATEIVDARWFSRRQAAAVYAGERVELGDGVSLQLPLNASIAAFLVARWLRGDGFTGAGPARSGVRP